MFRFLKYLFVMNRLRHAKRALAIVIASLVLLVLFLFISSDIGAYVDPDYTSIWLMCKWTIVITIIIVIGLGIRRVFVLFTRPFGRDQEIIDHRKETLLSKGIIFNKSERIIAKYKEVNQ